MKKKKLRKKRWFKKLKNNFNLITGIMIFILLIGSAFSVSLIFGIAFFLGFIFSVYNKSLEKRPFLPLMLFLGGLIIRTAFIWFFPPIFEFKTYLDLGLSVAIFLIILLIGFKIKKGEV
ncbi:MAG: hypothetical protein ABIE36_02430 [Candidatus Diapherotrites archaeon]